MNESSLFDDILIVDVVNGDETCPEGHSPLIQQKWFGLKEGCDCNRLQTKEARKNEPKELKASKVYGSKCSLGRIEEKCKVLRERKQEPIYKIFEDKLICRKLLQKIDIY